MVLIAYVAAALGAIRWQSVLKVFRDLKENFWEEYTMFELWQLAPALLTPVLSRFLEGWDPLGEPDRGGALARGTPGRGPPRGGGGALSGSSQVAMRNLSGQPQSRSQFSGKTSRAQPQTVAGPS
jgi:hypothetical protein